MTSPISNVRIQGGMGYAKIDQTIQVSAKPVYEAGPLNTIIGQTDLGTQVTLKPGHPCFEALKKIGDATTDKSGNITSIRIWTTHEGAAALEKAQNAADKMQTIAARVI